MSKVHNFGESLAYSHAAEDLPFWEEIYRRAFPRVVSIVSLRGDGWHQRAGIDRQITLDNGRNILIDEKVRKKDYGDILLEYLSDRSARAPGWVCKPLRCDFIAYAIAPAGRCYLLPVLQLQAAWEKYGKAWIQERPTIEARNEDKATGRSWTTVSVAVRPGELFPKIGAELRVSFKPYVGPVE